MGEDPTNWYDSGIIWTEKKTKYYHYVEEYTEINTQARVDKYDVLGYYVLYRSDKWDITSLTYIKLSEIIANAGGMANALTSFFDY